MTITLGRPVALMGMKVRNICGWNLPKLWPCTVRVNYLCFPHNCTYWKEFNNSRRHQRLCKVPIGCLNQRKNACHWYLNLNWCRCQTKKKYWHCHTTNILRGNMPEKRVIDIESLDSQVWVQRWLWTMQRQKNWCHKVCPTHQFRFCGATMHRDILLDSSLDW